MGTPDHARLVEVLRMAREIALQLEPLTNDANALPLRLAQAHALGLIDQLAEIVPEEPVEKALATLGVATYEEELIHA